MVGVTVNSLVIFYPSVNVRVFVMTSGVRSEKVSVYVKVSVKITGWFVQDGVMVSV
jgi:hypothetical protein